MLLSFALIILLGLSSSLLCQKLKLPGLLGMLLTGVIIGPFVLNWVDQSVLNISADLRKIALIIILTRAGLGLDLSVLKKNKASALMMCVVPATFEIIGTIVLASWLLGLSLLESAVLGSVLAAVSPAVVVPRMVTLMEKGYGVKKGIPQLILAGASVDDVYVIVLFSTFIGLMTGKDISVMSFVNIPISIIFGILLGLAIAKGMSYVFKNIELKPTLQVTILLAISFMLVTLEGMITLPITFSALIAIMFIGVGLKKINPEVSQHLSTTYNGLWSVAEIFLFVLVGATVNIHYFGQIGLVGLMIIAGAILIRMLGVVVSVIPTTYTKKEKLFTAIAYTPKATVQAGIGGVPLSLGLACGDAVLSIAVLAILMTAPVGAFFIDRTYSTFLTSDLE